MTALDQAFIKAYSSPTARQEGNQGDAAQRRRSAAHTIAEPVPPAAPVRRTGTSVVRAPHFPLQGSQSVDRRPRVEDLNIPPALCRDDAAVAAPVAAVAVEPVAPAPVAKPIVEKPVLAATLMPAAAPTVAPAPAAIAWPKLCDKIAASAAEELDRLADGLLGLGVGRPRVIGLMASRRGEGATTMALCAARRLAEGGRRVLLADGELDRGELAARLGLSPTTGWDDSLTGRITAEKAVRKIDERLSLLPVRAGHAWSAQMGSQMAGDLKRLAEPFDITLVNLGAIDDEQLAAGSPMASLLTGLSGVVVVHDVRSTTSERLTDICDRLSGLGVGELGLVENFRRV